MATESLTYDVAKEGEKIAQVLPKSGFGKAIYRGNQIASPVYKNALNEAFQEGAQYMIGDTAIDYYKNKLDYSMMNSAYTVFSRGKWAEIISEPIELTLE